MSTFHIQVISLGEVAGPDGYQRDIDEPTVGRIVDNFDAAQWDIPKVAEVADGYRVIAGQHRIEAAREFLSANTWPFTTPQGFLDVQVIRGLDTVGDEADLFLKDAGNKKPIAPFYKHRAGLIAGYQFALDIQTALDKYGVKLVRRQKVLNGETFVAISSLNAIWRGSKGNGRVVIDETLRLRSLWKKDDTYRSDGSLIGGLGIVVRELLQSDGNVARLDKLVKRHSALNIASAAVKLASREGQGMSLSQPLTYAVVIRGLLGPAPKTRTPDPKPAFVSRFPVAVEVGAI